MSLSWSEIVNDGTPGRGLNGARAMSQPTEPDPGAEAAWERFMGALGMEPWQLISRAPITPDPAERAYAELILSMGGIPWSVER